MPYFHIHRALRAVRCGLWLLIGGLPLSSAAQETDSIALPADTAVCSAVADTAAAEGKHGVVQRVLDYFRQSNKPRPDRRVDFGFLPGPHYSSTAGLGLGILGTATYTTDAADPALPRSNASLFADMTTGGFFLVGLRGNHIFPQERYRLDYKLTVSTFSTSFWGIGYGLADNDADETDYRRNRIIAMARFMFNIAPNTFLGPLVNYSYFQARGIEEGGEWLWQGQPRTIRTYTAGLSLTYDSRDFMLNARRGIFFQLDQTFSPRCFGNGDHGFSTTELALSGYREVWKNGVLAAELHGKFNYGHTPWPLLAEVGDNHRMRGYYEGRYRDRNLVEGQVELRQHIKGRSGVALWLAAANAFPDFDSMRWKHTLPNAGVGYRWEFKKGINVRIDYGFTRNGGGVIFNINEAF